MSKKKKVNYVLVERRQPSGKSMTTYPLDPYPVLDRMLAHHPDLAGARIGVAWRKEWAPNRDGQTTLGKCKKASDLDRCLVEFDFLIILNQFVWEAVLDASQRDALMDHELSHAAPDMDGPDQKRDENGRLCWRTRRHDLEEFHGVVKRHGLYLDDVRAFAEAALAARDREEKDAGTLPFEDAESA